MFYLNKYFLVMFKNPVRMVMFLLSGLSLSLLLGQPDKIQNNILSHVPKWGSQPHFFALIDDSISSQNIRRKLMSLPGVSAVNNISKNEIEKQLSQVLGEIGMESFEGETPSVMGLKVSFNKGLEIRSQTLIKKYLSQLSSSEKITVGPTVGGNKAKSGTWVKDLKSSLRIRVGLILLFLAAALYLTLGIGLSREVAKEAYLIERFSRRTNVVEVIAGIGFTCVTAVLLAPAFFMGSINMVGCAIFSSVTLIFFISSTRKGWSRT